MTTLRIHLRGGQTIEKVVDDWSLKKSLVTNELTELRWSADGDETLPYIRLDSIDAVISVKETP
jgi:hypothetical protein